MKDNGFRHGFLFALLLVMFFVSPVHAQLVGSDTAPGSSCTAFPAGASRMTADADTDGKGVILICNGTTWEVDGSISAAIVIQNPSDCDDGEFPQYQSATSNWWCPIDATPDAFSFTDQIDVALSTQILSNIETITGIDSGTGVSISGDGSPQFRINGGSWVTSGTIDSGDTLQLGLTSNAANSTTNSATVTVGTVSDQWDVTTEASVPTGCPDIGDVCNDGSIFAGDTNMYVTDVNQSTGKEWKNSTGTNDINPDSDTDGQANHDNRGGTLSNFPAFELCENLNRHGYTDWYLPAKYELDVLYTNKVAIGGFSTSNYWSSTESGNTSAWRQSFGTGSQLSSTKTGNGDVRCVRRD